MAKPNTAGMQDTRRSLEWSDLQVILAICRTGSINGAAKTLGKTRSTVFRNINAIEERTGVRYFDRFDNGYFMTDAGRVAMDTAERIEADVKALEVQVMGRDERLSGRIRVTCMDAFATEEAPLIFARFNAVHPDISVDVSPDLSQADLGRREAEVAIRATRKAPESSFGRKLCPFRFALYSTEAYMAKARARRLAEHRFCFVEGMASWLVPTVWTSREEAEDCAVFQCSRARAVLNATALGLGITIMPCYAGDQDERLIRVSDPIRNLDMHLWVLTHPDLRNTARVRALMSFLYDDLASRADTWSGAKNPPRKWNLIPRDST